MRFKYAFDVLAALREAGYSTYKLRSDKLLSESTIQKIRVGTMVSLDQIGIICDMLHCMPWELIECIPSKASKHNVSVD